MPSTSQQIIQTLWRYCNILRDDGLSYPDYVEQLTYLLFLKMAHEQRRVIGDIEIIPETHDWKSLISKSDKRHLHSHYGEILRRLGGESGMLTIIFGGAENKIRDPAKLSLLVNDLIDKKTWSDLDADVKGDAYEGLLERNAQDTKSGAGQYFTPRPVINAVIDVIQPMPGETICDPACGSCGFLLAAVDYVRRLHPNLSQRQRDHLRLQAIHGNELVPAVARLGAMNLFLHGIGPMRTEASPPIKVGDSLKHHPGAAYDVVVTNPPFGRKSSVTVLREIDQGRLRDLTIHRKEFWASTSNKQLNFLQHVVSIVAPSGRVAIVVPDNVLFEGGAGEVIRRRLLHEFDVHTLLRLPAGIFYAGGVKANVLFFDRRDDIPVPRTRSLWVYDLRTGFRVTLRSNPIQRSDLDEFVSCYESGNITRRRATWSDKNPTGRWRAFDYDQIIAARHCNLDFTWRLHGGQVDEDLLSSSQLASEIIDDLRMALRELESVEDEITE